MMVLLLLLTKSGETSSKNTCNLFIDQDSKLVILFSGDDQYDSQGSNLPASVLVSDQNPHRYEHHVNFSRTSQLDTLQNNHKHHESALLHQLHSKQHSWQTIWQEQSLLCFSFHCSLTIQPST